MFLGNATIQYKFVGCAIDPEDLSDSEGQADVRESYLVPAHYLEVRVTDVLNHERAVTAFRDSPIMKDLSNINQVEEETSEAESEENEFSRSTAT